MGKEKIDFLERFGQNVTSKLSQWEKIMKIAIAALISLGFIAYALYHRSPYQLWSVSVYEYNNGERELIFTGQWASPKSARAAGQAIIMFLGNKTKNCNFTFEVTRSD